MKNLNEIDARAAKSVDKDEILELSRICQEQIIELTERLFSEKKQSLLLILQGLSGAGKDSTVKALFSGISPTQTHSVHFIRPTHRELSHDFLWRIHKEIPAKGRIGIFNRSHYEDIIVPFVAETLPLKTIDQRVAQINNFEQYLEENGVKVVKCLFHISKEKQKEKLEKRIYDSSKHYKHDDADWIEQEKRQRYLEIFQKIVNECSHIPWNIIPSDQKWYRIYVTRKILLEALQDINPQFPKLKSERFS